MLPVVRGDSDTRREILAYAIVLVALTLVPVPPASSGPSTWSRRWRSAPASSAWRWRCWCARRRAPRCGCTSPPSPTSRCCSARWRWTGSSDRTAGDGPGDGAAKSEAGPPGGADRPRRLRPHLLRHDPLHRLVGGVERNAPEPTELVYVPESNTVPASSNWQEHYVLLLAGFIAATGIAVAALSWYGVRRGEWWAWIAAVVSPVVGLAVALPYHYMGHFEFNWGHTSRPDLPCDCRVCRGRSTGPARYDAKSLKAICEIAVHCACPLWVKSRHVQRN